MIDEVGKEIFEDLAAEGRDIYHKRLAEYQHQDPLYMQPSYMKPSHRYKADRKIKSAEAAKKKSTIDAAKKNILLPATHSPTTEMDMLLLEDMDIEPLQVLSNDSVKNEEDSSYGYFARSVSEDNNVTSVDTNAGPSPPSLPFMKTEFEKLSNKLAQLEELIHEAEDESNSSKTTTSSASKRHRSVSASPIDDDTHASPPKVTQRVSFNLVTPRTPIRTTPLDQEHTMSHVVSRDSISARAALQLPLPPPPLTFSPTRSVMQDAIPVENGVSGLADTGRRFRYPRPAPTDYPFYVAIPKEDATFPTLPSFVEGSEKLANNISPSSTTKQEVAAEPLFVPPPISLEPTATKQDVQLEAPMTPPPDISVEDFMELFFPTTPSFGEMEIEDSEKPEAYDPTPLNASEQDVVVEPLQLTIEDCMELMDAL